MANQTPRSTANDCALRRLLPLMLPLLILTGCARQEPVNETLPILNQLREQQMAEQPQLQLQYQNTETQLPADQEQQLHQFLGRKDPARIALISGPGLQTDMLESARMASVRLTALTRLLGARAIELEPRYDPMQAPNTLLIRILPSGESGSVTPAAAQ
ncbi:hypothetical protein K3H46_01545 [Aeromonas veronii]|uniref:hypothetical protein n=1 Tax=Aeromonas veronii TaxID=654 RepID=UPI001117A4F0|nr:hypothetical protein [Aeromonas veronii]MCF5889710.1 hypothetical protein [Aeromonas veronii]